jgi:hypothetical protein
MSGLATSLSSWYRFGKTGSTVDLNEAILTGRKTLSLRPTSHPDRSSSLTNLGLRLWNRFRGTGSMADLAILRHRESLPLCSTRHPNHSTLNNLGSGLMERLAMTAGSMTDLKEAISIHRVSLSLRPAPHPRRSFSLNNLANALLYRFLQTGLLTDLQECILLHRYPSVPPHSITLQVHLGNYVERQAQ